MINVLIVDDDSMVAELNRLFLSRVADFHCCGVAPTVREAREMLSHLAQVDLVLLDVYMQQENGLDLLEPPLYVCPGPGPAPERIRTGPRIGIDYAQEAAEFPWRFWFQPEEGEDHAVF